MAATTTVNRKHYDVEQDNGSLVRYITENGRVVATITYPRLLVPKNKTVTAKPKQKDKPAVKVIKVYPVLKEGYPVIKEDPTEVLENE